VLHAPASLLVHNRRLCGSGLMASKLGAIFAGHDVVFSCSRSERKLRRLAREAEGHGQAGTPREAAANADAVLLAVRWSRIDDVWKQAGDLSSKLVIACSLRRCTSLLREVVDRMCAFGVRHHA
jgi:predicted dinucleotide-binding enzyme